MEWLEVVVSPRSASGRERCAKARHPEEVAKKSDAAREAYERTRASIDAELAALGGHHAWAGKYFFGDGTLRPALVVGGVAKASCAG